MKTPVSFSEAKRFSWKTGRVYAFESLNSIWVLGQVVGPIEIAFFDAFAQKCDFKVTDWYKSSLLFHVTPTRQFLKHTKFRVAELQPKDFTISNTWIDIDRFTECRRVVLWAGTESERRLNVEYGGSLIKAAKSEKSLRRGSGSMIARQLTEMRLPDWESVHT